jgi:hypothetical protein
MFFKVLACVDARLIILCFLRYSLASMRGYLNKKLLDLDKDHDKAISKFADMLMKSL